MSAKPEKKILLIDDDPNILKALSALLGIQGYEVKSAASGSAGTKIAASFQPDVVVTDILMDDGDGLETMMTLRQSDPNVKIVAISGGGRVVKQDFLVVAKEIGADLTISKPFRSSQLVEEISQLLAAG